MGSFKKADFMVGILHGLTDDAIVMWVREEIGVKISRKVKIDELSCLFFPIPGNRSPEDEPTPTSERTIP